MTLLFPKDMVGKRVEIIAFEINEERADIIKTKAQRLKEIEELTKGSLVDLSSFKFDRNEVNNCDE